MFFPENVFENAVCKVAAILFRWLSDDYIVTNDIIPEHDSMVSTILESRARLNTKTVFPCIGISIVKIKRSWDRLIFITGIPIPVRRHLKIDTAPSCLDKQTLS